MKILYVSAGKIPSEAANSVHVMKMAQAFGGHGNDVTLAYPVGEKNHKPDTALFARYAVKPVFTLFPVRSPLPVMQRIHYGMRAAIESLRGKYALVFSRCIPSAFCAAVLGRTVMLELHDSPNSLNPIPKWLLRRLLKSSSLIGIVVISSALKEHIADLCGYPLDKILTLHDGADPFLAERAVDLKIPDLNYHVGYTGHLYQGRGIDIILSLAAQCPDIGFHIVGGRPDDVAYWKNLYSGSNIYFYGHVPHKDVSGYIAAFDVLLAPYQKKVSVHGNIGNTAEWMSPLKVFEYMASGKPIICSDIAVLREVLVGDQNCLLCEPENIDSWRAALLLLRKDGVKAKEIGLAAKQDFEKNYTWFARAGKILDYFKKTG